MPTVDLKDTLASHYLGQVDEEMGLSCQPSGSPDSNASRDPLKAASPLAQSGDEPG